MKISQENCYGRRKISVQGINILPQISGRVGQPQSADAISRPTRHKFFCSMYELSQRHPVWVAEIHVTACNSVPSTAGAPSEWWGAHSSNSRDPWDETTAIIKTATVGLAAAQDTANISGCHGGKDTSISGNNICKRDFKYTCNANLSKINQ